MNDIARGAQEFLKTDTDVRLALLFGSASQGTMTPESDIDIAIALHSGEMSIERKIDLATAVEAVLFRTVDVIDLFSAEGLILCEAIGGEVLVEDVMLRSSLAIKAMDYRENLLPSVLQAQKESVKDWIDER